MKTGMNLLLWTTHVTEEHFPLFAKLKKAGYDGVELPLFAGDATHYKIHPQGAGQPRPGLHDRLLLPRRPPIPSAPTRDCGKRASIT